MFRTLKKILAKKYDRIEERPYFDFKLKELEELYLRSQSLGNKGIIDTIVHELNFRTTSSSRKLLLEIQDSKKLLSQPTAIDFPDKADALRTSQKLETPLVDEETLPAKEKSNADQLVSFHALVKNLSRSDKPEIIINSTVWEMFCNSLKDDEKQYTPLPEVAKKLECSWPYVERKNEISDYLNIDFEELKKKYGWDQKRVIISAVAMASYAKVKSWRVLNKRYGPKTKQKEFYFDDPPDQDGNVTPNKGVARNSVSSDSTLKNERDEIMTQSEERSNPRSRDEASTPKSSVDAILDDFDI